MATSERSRPSVKLIGVVEGNAFAIMGTVSRALRRAGYTPEEIEQYRKEATEGNYDHLLQVTRRWVEVE